MYIEGVFTMAHKPYGLNELREMYLKFFETKGHLRLPILILHAHASRKRTICSRSYSPPSMLMRSVRSGGSVFAHSS